MPEDRQEGSERMPKIDASRSDLVEEFRRNPVGCHSGDLRRLLNAMRTDPDLPGYVLVCTRPQREWRLAVRRPGRGQPLELVPGVVFHDAVEAEWEVFRLRWQALTGDEIVP
jgi:hypothetical protein